MDIKMSTGKLAAQVAHAAVTSALEAMKYRKEWFKKWIKEGQKKVVLKVKSEQELVDLWKSVKDELPNALIQDRGLTELPPGTITALGIGPAPESIIDKYTGKLPLL